MAIFREWNIDGEMLLPPRMEDWLDPGHMAIWLRDLVYELTRMDLTHWRKESQGGRPSYHPSMMATVLIFAYMRGTRSSRRISQLLCENVAFRVISGDQHPDFRTICAFRRAHHAWLQRVFTRVLLLAQELGMVDLGAVLVDGTVFQAAASKKRSRRLKTLRKQFQEAAEEEAERMGLAAETLAQRLLEEAETVDQAEDSTYGDEGYPDPIFAVEPVPENRLRRIRTALVEVERAERKRQAKRLKRQAALVRLCLRRRRTGRPSRRVRSRNAGIPGIKRLLSRLTQVAVPKAARGNTTDPESRRLPQAQTGGFVQGHRQLRATDANSGIILDVKAVTGTGESRGLPSVIERVIRRVGIQPLPRVVTDKGFAGEPALKALEGKVLEAVIPQLKHSRKSGRVKEAKALCSKRRYWMKKRKRIESGFGHTKENKGFRRLLLRGKRGAEIEWLLDALGHNLQKVFAKFKLVPEDKIKRSLAFSASLGF